MVVFSISLDSFCVSLDRFSISLDRFSISLDFFWEIMVAFFFMDLFKTGLKSHKSNIQIFLSGSS